MDDIRETLKLRDNLRHRDVVAFENALFKLPARYLTAARLSSMTADVYVRAAIDAEWIVAPHCESGDFGKERRYFVDGTNLDELPAWVPRYVGEQISALYDALTAVPKN